MASKKARDLLDREVKPPEIKIGPLASKTPIGVANIPLPVPEGGSTIPRKPLIEFKVYRENPDDPFKPNSESAVHRLAQYPRKDALHPDDELMIQAIGASLDRSLSVEEIIKYPFKPTKYSAEITEQLERLPSWLRPMIELRMDVIRKHFNETDTLKFLRLIADRIDREYRSDLVNYNGPISMDMEDQVELMKREPFEEYDVSDTIEGDNSAKPDTKVEPGSGRRSLNVFGLAVLVARWKRKSLTTDDRLWAPESIHNAAVKLRNALIVKPATAEIGYPDDVNVRIEGKDDKDKDDGTMEWKRRLKDDVEKELVEKELRAETKFQRKMEKQMKAREARRVKKAKLERKKKARDEKKKKLQEAKKKAKGKGKGKEVDEEEKAVALATKEVEKIKSEIEKMDLDEKKESENSEESEEEMTKEMKQAKKKKVKDERKKKKRLTKNQKFKQMMSRGHFRRHSRLFHSDCGDPDAATGKLEDNYRIDESFHAFIVTLVGSTYFKVLVLGMILLSIVILTLETISTLEDKYLFFEFWDEFFLAFYLLEALLKIYAHPITYWTSGFNVFDFIILLISLTKSVLDWLDYVDITSLRVLLIVRALRLLRGISLSVQMQVLVTALVETIKTNVLSIVILLVLLVYIAAIVAFYFFGDKPGLVGTWGKIGRGMLNMIAFVTVDGWYELMKTFEEAGYTASGRIFNLICIVLGNFMFSNIFIAIIILNISEATDKFRDKIQTEREEVVRIKKESVFRRQKLDIRQLLGRQHNFMASNFYELANQFQTMLRHDDFVGMEDVFTAPLWIDACYQCMLRTEHTSNLLMNLHREMADNLYEQKRFYDENKTEVNTLTRGRYNRYMKLKAKLALIKQEMLRMRNPPESNLRIRFDHEDSPPPSVVLQAPEPGATTTTTNKTAEPVKEA